MIAFSCPGCRQPLQTGVEAAGKPVRCPHCRMLLTVPGGPPPPETVAAPNATVDLPAPATLPAEGSAATTILPRRAENASASDAAASPNDSLHSPVPPEQGGPGQGVVPGYEILGELGRGGMGVVYKARQVKLKRLVALKMILAGGHAGPADLERFRGEAEAVARLQHPGIVQIHEIGEHDGRPFLSLEYVHGGSLADKVKGNPFPAREAAALVEVLARSVHVAHRQGVVHRDLKPANVLLTEDGAPKIADFGLAKQLDAEGGQTQSGAIVGTPGYMAPEQAAGQGRLIGPAADVHALGAILYELLTGRPPFRGASPLDTILQVVSEEPVPPSRLTPRVPRDLETICLKCLEKQPARRYASALALADDLQRHLAGQVIHARPVGPIARLGRWCRRNPVVAGLIAVVVLSLLAGSGVAGYFAVHMSLEAKRAQENEARAEANARRASDEGERAVREEKANRAHAYVTQMNVIADAWEGGDVAAVQRLLESLVPRPGQEDVRGPEWHTFWQLCHGFRYAVPGRSAVFVDGGRTLAVGGPGLFGQFEAATGQPRRRLDRPGEGVFVAGQDARGHVLAVIWKRLNDKKVWELTLARPFLPDRPPLVSVSFDRNADLSDPTMPLWALSADARTFVIASASAATDKKAGKIRLWDLAAGKEHPPVPEEPANVYCLALSGDGRTLALAGGSGKVEERPTGRDQLRLHDVVAGRPPGVLPGPAPHARAVALTPDGKTLGVAAAVWEEARQRWMPGDVKLWDLDARKERRSCRYEWLVRSLAFAPDGKALAAGPADRGPVRVWDAAGDRRIDLWGAPGAVESLSLAANGESLAAAGEDGQVRVWDPRASRPAEPVGRIRGWGEEGRAVAFSPDGKTLATGGLDETIRLWDVASGREKAALHGHRGTVNALAYSPDGRLLVSGSDDQTVRVWTPDGQLLRVQDEAGPVRCLAFQPGGAVLAVGAGSEVRLRNPATGRIAHALAGAGKVVQNLVFTPDGRTLAAAGHGEVYAWDSTSGALRPGYPRTHTGVRSVACTPDSLGLIAGNASGGLHCWEIATGKDRRTSLMEGSRFPVTNVALSPDGKLLAAAINYNESLMLYCWSWNEDQKLISVFKGGFPNASCLAVSPDHRLAAVALRDGTVALMNNADGVVQKLLPGHAAGVTAVAFSPDGELLAEGRADFTIRLRNRRTGQERRLHGHEGQVRCVGFSADGKRLVSGSPDATVKLWQTETGRILGSYQTRQKWAIRSVAISSDGLRVAGGEGRLDSSGNEVTIWEVGGEKPPLTLKPNGWEVWGLAFSPDGRRLTAATGSFWSNLHGNAGVWDLATGKRLTDMGNTFTRNEDTNRNQQENTWRFASLALSPDGRWLAGGGRDATVRLWDLSASTPPLEFKGHTVPISHLAFSADGATLASVDESGSIRFWDREGRARPGRLRIVAPAALAVGPGGKSLAVADRRPGPLQIWQGGPAQVLAAYDAAAAPSEREGGSLESRQALLRLRSAVLQAQTGNARAAWACFHQADAALRRRPSSSRTDGRLADALLAMAAAFARQGAREQTIQAYARATEASPAQGQIHLQLARELHYQGKLVEAIASCRKAIQRGSDNDAADWLLGTLLWQTNNLSEASKAYQRMQDLLRRLVEKNPGSTFHQADLGHMHFNLASVLWGLGRREEALKAFREAVAVRRGVVKAHPQVPGHRQDLANTHNDLGVLLRDMRRSEEAVKEYRQALDLRGKLVKDHPESAAYLQTQALTHDNLGLALADLGKPGEAVKEYRQAIDLRGKLVRAHPEAPQHLFDLAGAHLRLGGVLFILGERDEALKELRQAIDLHGRLVKAHPEEPLYQKDLGIAHTNLGQVLFQTGKSEEAREEYQRAIDLISKLARERPEAIEYQQELGRTHDYLGGVLAALGKRDEAVKEYQRACDLRSKLARSHPERPQYQHDLANTHSNRGGLLAALGKPDEAVKEYRQSIDLNSKLVKAYPEASGYRYELGCTHTYLGNLLVELGKRDEALKAYRQAVDHQSKVVNAHPRVVVYQREKGRTHNNLGLLLAGEGKRLEAVREYQQGVDLLGKLVKTHPGHPRDQEDLALTRTNLGNVLSDQGKRDEAWEQYRQALDLRRRLVANHPGDPQYRHGLAATHINRGNLLNARGKPDEAQKEYRLAIDINSKLLNSAPDRREYQHNLAVTHHNLALALTAGGKREEAVKEYRQARDLRRKLVKMHPGIPGYQDELATTLNHLGGTLLGLDKRDEAGEEFRQAVDLRRRLVENHPGVPPYLYELAVTRNNLAILLAALGKHDEAQKEYRVAIGLHTRLVEAHPESPRHHQQLAVTHNNLGNLLSNLGKREEALKEYRQAIDLNSTLVKDHPESASYRQALARTYYKLGCTHALNAASIARDAARPLPERDKRAEQDVRQALAHLERAASAGHFRDPENVAQLDREADLAFLRDRDDYKRFRAGLKARK